MWNDNENDFEGNGGFENTTNMFQSPTSEQQPKGQGKPRATAPVAIKQILDCPEDGLKIKDIDVQVVRVVGIVKAVEVTSIKISYTIEDSTGSILGVSYLESDADDNNAPVPVVENTYCVMTGSIRSQGGSKHIMVFNIYPVTDFNEIIEHYLAVIHMSYKAEQNPVEIPEKTGLKEDMMSYYKEGKTEGGNYSTVDPKHRNIYEVIRRCISESGINIDQIMQNLTVKVPHATIRASLEHLVNEGHIFTTIDENHFKSTESSF